MKEGLDDYVVKSPRQLPRLRTSLRIAVDMAKSRADLSDREAHLARALAQQQVIVRELHHRVKNNLQTVTSLLSLRARTVDAATRRHLEEIAGQMRALGAVQERIYESAEFDRVDFRAALGDLAASLIRDRRDGRVTMTSDLGVPLVLDVAHSMPLGLVCHEIILNAVKQAWPPGSSGTLTVQIVESDGGPAIRIADDGTGDVGRDLTRGHAGPDLLGDRGRGRRGVRCRDVAGWRHARDPEVPLRATIPAAGDAGTVVLVVEDEAVIRMMLASELEDAGFVVIEARNADVAMAIIADRPDIAVVVTDIRMPGTIDGLGLAAWMRGHAPSIPVIITAGFAARPDIAAINPAIARIVAKPYDTQAIVTCVRELGSRPVAPPG